MATIAEQLTKLNDAKEDIKEAIEAKGVQVGDAPLAEYADKIEQITGGGGELPEGVIINKAENKNVALKIGGTAEPSTNDDYVSIRPDYDTTKDTETTWTVAIGYQSAAPRLGSTVVGKSAKSKGNYGTAIGCESSAEGANFSTAIGHKAVASGEKSIQIGGGTNDEPGTLKVGFFDWESRNARNYKLLDADGIIPAERMPDALPKTYTVMPERDNENRIVQYIGESDGTYTNGYFYKYTIYETPPVDVALVKSTATSPRVVDAQKFFDKIKSIVVPKYYPNILEGDTVRLYTSTGSVSLYYTRVGSTEQWLSWHHSQFESFGLDNDDSGGSNASTFEIKSTGEGRLGWVQLDVQPSTGAGGDFLPTSGGTLTGGLEINVDGDVAQTVFSFGQSNDSRPDWRFYYPGRNQALKFEGVGVSADELPFYIKQIRCRPKTTGSNYVVTMPGKEGTLALREDMPNFEALPDNFRLYWENNASYIKSEGTNIEFGMYNDTIMYMDSDGLNPNSDASFDLGWSDGKWKTVYATELNNGAKIAIPTKGGTIALVEDLPDTTSFATKEDIKDFVTLSQVWEDISPSFGTVQRYVEEQVESKQDKLTPGENITIVDGVISAAGGAALPETSDETAGKYLTNENGEAKWSDKKPLVNEAVSVWPTSVGICLGMYGESSGSDSVAIGRDAISTGGRSVAIGGSIEAHGTASIAMGDGSRANDGHSIALGRQARAKEGAIALSCCNYTEAEKGEFVVGLGGGSINSGYKLLDHNAGGLIPSARFALEGVNGQVLVKKGDFAEWASIEGGGVSLPEIPSGTTGKFLTVDSSLNPKWSTNFVINDTAKSIVMGTNATTVNNKAVVVGASAFTNGVDAGIAIGYNASVYVGGKYQIGEGQNTTCLLQVKDFPLINYDGTIPVERTPLLATKEDIKGFVTMREVDENYGPTLSQILHNEEAIAELESNKADKTDVDAISKDVARVKEDMADTEIKFQGLAGTVNENFSRIETVESEKADKSMFKVVDALPSNPEEGVFYFVRKQ